MRLLRPSTCSALLAFAACAWLAGCDPADNRGFTSELNDSNYVRGTQLLRTGRSQEALSAFLKVVDKRGGDAPESHLQAGILYLQQIKDPVAAIYHFNRFLELKPNSQQSEYVRQLVDQGKKDFARLLPAQPFEGQIERMRLIETVDKLQKENFELKEEIARLRGLPPTHRPQAAAVVPPEETAPLQAAETDEGDTAVVPATPTNRPAVTTPSRPASTQGSAPVANNPPAPAGGRVHTVQAKETLWSISMRYYGNGRRVNDIIAANPGTLSGPNPALKVGMQIRIP